MVEKRHLARATLVDLAEEELLELVVARKDTGTSDTTEDVGTSTLEERPGALGGNDGLGGVEHVLVVGLGAGGHHHTTTDRVERVRSETSTSGNSPAEEERGPELTLEGTSEENRLERVVLLIGKICRSRNQHTV